MAQVTLEWNGRKFTTSIDAENEDEVWDAFSVRPEDFSELSESVFNAFIEDCKIVEATYDEPESDEDEEKIKEEE